MSMPQPFNVAVVSDRYPRGGEVAASVVAVLRGSGSGDDIRPDIRPALVAASTFVWCRLALSRSGIAQGFAISEAIHPYLLNINAIDLWLALDPEGEKNTSFLIQKYGPAPRSFYRTVFPESVIACGFTVPDPPSDEKFNSWLDLLIKLFAPWRKRIWDAFYESS